MDEDPATKRLWEHLLHDDDIFNHRLSFFLVNQSVLVAVVGLLYQKNANNSFMLVLSGMGVLLTLVWQYVQARQYYILKKLKARVKEKALEYKETVEIRQGRWPVSSTVLLTLLPLLFLFLWACFLYFFLSKSI